MTIEEEAGLDPTGVPGEDEEKCDVTNVFLLLVMGVDGLRVTE